MGLCILGITIAATVIKKNDPNKTFEETTKKLDGFFEKFLDTAKAMDELRHWEKIEKNTGKTNSVMLQTTQELTKILERGQGTKPRSVYTFDYLLNKSNGCLKIDPKQGKVVLVEPQIEYSSYSSQKDRIDKIKPQWKDFYNKFVSDKKEDKPAQAIKEFLKKLGIDINYIDEDYNRIIAQKNFSYNIVQQNIELINAVFEPYTKLSEKFSSLDYSKININKNDIELVEKLISNIENTPPYLKFRYYDDEKLDKLAKALFVEVSCGETPGIFTQDGKLYGNFQGRVSIEKLKHQ